MKKNPIIGSKFFELQLEVVLDGRPFGLVGLELAFLKKKR